MGDDLALMQELYERATRAEAQAKELQSALSCMTAMTIACGGKIIVDQKSAAKAPRYELIRYRDEALNALVLQARPEQAREARDD